MTKRTAEAQMNTPYLLGTYLASNKEVKGMRANCVRGARSVREVGEARGRGQAITYAYLTYAYLRLGSRSAQKPEVWEDSQQQLWLYHSSVHLRMPEGDCWDIAVACSLPLA